MLVLSRKEGERIQIGPDVFVTVVALQGGKVRLGIDAPPDVHILRGELVPQQADTPVATSPAADLTVLSQT